MLYIYISSDTTSAYPYRTQARGVVSGGGTSVADAEPVSAVEVGEAPELDDFEDAGGSMMGSSGFGARVAPSGTGIKHTRHWCCIVGVRTYPYVMGVVTFVECRSCLLSRFAHETEGDITVLFWVADSLLGGL